MENTVNTAADQGATAGFANESASDFAFAPEPAAQPAAAQATQTAGQKGAGAVDAQRSADARGNEPRRAFAQNRFQRPQKDIGKAFGKESERVRTQAEREYAEKLEADPDRVIARRLVTDLMRSKGITEEQARQELDNGFYTAIAEREGISPGMARMLYAQQQQQQAAKNPAQEAKPEQNQQPQQSGDDIHTEARAIVDELMSIELPQDFDLEEAFQDTTFTELLTRYPAEAAVEVYTLRKQTQTAQQAAEAAPQQLADRLRARAEVPQSSRSSLVPGAPNFKTMTTQEYRKYQKDNHLT